MVGVALLARLEGKARPVFTQLADPHQVVSLYSRKRADFLERLVSEQPAPVVPTGFSRTLWGLAFRSPIMNAAGMFKNGQGYDFVAAQGAGAYLGGTVTATERRGNTIKGVEWPFAPYPHSGAASNALGLPNPGHEAVGRRIYGLRRHPGCPLGMSVMADPAIPDEHERLERLAEGMHFLVSAGVDFLEQNESCPNTGEGPLDTKALRERMAYVQQEFIRSRERFVPVILKLSNDTKLQDARSLVELAIEYGYDGVNFGNTSTDYLGLRESVDPRDRRLFDYFTSTFKGGVSGAPLRDRSLSLAALAVHAVEDAHAGREFHVIRTGGVLDAGDMRLSEHAGIALNQWFTGYFENFGKHGHRVYDQIYRRMSTLADI